jgi:hypothetical protein
MSAPILASSPAFWLRDGSVGPGGGCEATSGRTGCVVALWAGSGRAPLIQNETQIVSEADVGPAVLHLLLCCGECGRLGGG